MPVTKDQAQQLTALAVACRPNGASRWDEAGVMAAIGKVKHLSLADVALAVIRAADSRDCQTPGVITNLSSPCWRERADSRPQTLTPYDANEFCDICGKHKDQLHPHHEFVSAAQHVHRVADQDPDRRAYLLDMARENVVAAKEQRTPAPEVKHEPNPNVDRLRAAKEPA